MYINSLFRKPNQLINDSKKLFILLNLVLLLFPVYGAYNVQNAKNYALQWARSYNTGSTMGGPYWIYDSRDCNLNPPDTHMCDGDCANFVSQCLKYGTIEPNLNYRIDLYGCIVSADDLSYWIRNRYLSNNSSRFDTSLSEGTMPKFDVEVGDVIQFGGFSSAPNRFASHSAIVSSVTSQSYSGIGICTHSSAKRDEPLSSVRGYKRIHFYDMVRAGGINDIVAIDNPDTSVNIFDNVSYTATFTDADYSGSYTDVWDWEIVAYHSGGTYTLASASGLVGHNQITWNTQINSLPQGYNWTITDGGICSHVLVRTLDSDGYLHEKQVGIKINYITASSSFTGTNIGMNNNFDVNGPDGADVAYLIHLPSQRILNVSTCNSVTNFDTKLEIFNFNRLSTGFYNDDDNSCSFGNRNSTLRNISLPAGDYYVVVDGYNGAIGNFGLNIEMSEQPRVSASSTNALIAMFGLLLSVGLLITRKKYKIGQ